MKSKFDLVTELVSGVKGKSKEELEQIAQRLHQEINNLNSHVE